MSPSKRPKKTTGVWAMEEAPVYFLASNPHVGSAIAGPPVHGRWMLVAVNELLRRAEREWLKVALDSGVRVFLDSGIFALTNRHAREHGLTMDQALTLAPDEIDGFEELWTAYGEIVDQYRDRLWGVIELDQGGAVQKRKTRARIEHELGVVPIPVYHPLLDGWDYFDELAAGYDRLCFGNVVQAAAPHRLRLLHTAYERARAYPHLWIHVLGLTPSEWCLSAAPRGSCDSSTWTTNVRWPEAQRLRAALAGIDRLPGEFAYVYGADTLSNLAEYERLWPELHDMHDVVINPVGRFRALQFGAAQGVFHGEMWKTWLDELEEVGLR